MFDQVMESSRTSLTAPRQQWTDRETYNLAPHMRPATQVLAEQVLAIHALASDAARDGLRGNLDYLYLEVSTMRSERFRDLLQAGEVNTARVLVTAEPAASVWNELLSLPRVRSGPASAATGFHENQVWLRLHADAHAGQWVALKDGVLVGHHPSRLALHKSLKERGSLAGVLFVRLG